MRAVMVSSPSKGPVWNGMSAAVSENGSGKALAGIFLTAISVPRALGLSEIRRATRYSVPAGLVLAMAGASTILPAIEPPAAGAAALGAGGAAGAGAAGAGVAGADAGSSGGTGDGLPEPSSCFWQAEAAPRLTATSNARRRGARDMGPNVACLGYHPTADARPHHRRSGRPRADRGRDRPALVRAARAAPPGLQGRPVRLHRHPLLHPRQRDR